MFRDDINSTSKHIYVMFSILYIGHTQRNIYSHFTLHFLLLYCVGLAKGNFCRTYTSLLNMCSIRCFQILNKLKTSVGRISLQIYQVFNGNRKEKVSFMRPQSRTHSLLVLGPVRETNQCRSYSLEFVCISEELFDLYCVKPVVYQRNK